MSFLVFSLILSTILLGVVNHVARTSPNPVRPILWWTAIIPFCALFMTRISYAFLLQAALLVVCAPFVSKARPWRYLATSIAATCLAYAIVGVWVGREIVLFRAANPFESLEARLPVPTDRSPIRLDDHSLADLSELEVQVSRNSDFQNGYRTEALTLLHENAVQAFASRAGFGVGRMPFRGVRLDEDLALEPLLQPVPDAATMPEATGAFSAGHDQATMVEEPGAAEELRSTHGKWLPEFFRSEGFGLFRDRAHVAGFRPHGFKARPVAPTRVKRVELVGLVVHAEPVVYMTGTLPTMAQLATVPLRPLDPFENAGLAELREGKSLFVRRVDADLRVLGPVRAGHACTTCHGCERGRLLGAFSYHLD